VPGWWPRTAGETAERVRGLQSGRDDYIPPPCDPRSSWRGRRASCALKARRTDRIPSCRSRLEQMVVSDPLTGLHNRRYLMDRMLQEMTRRSAWRAGGLGHDCDLDASSHHDSSATCWRQGAARVGSAISKSVRVSDIARGTAGTSRRHPSPDARRRRQCASASACCGTSPKSSCRTRREAFRSPPAWTRVLPSRRRGDARGPGPLRRRALYGAKRRGRTAIRRYAGPAARHRVERGDCAERLKFSTFYRVGRAKKARTAPFRSRLPWPAVRNRRGMDTRT